MGRYAGLHRSWLRCCFYGCAGPVRLLKYCLRSPLGNTVKGHIIRGAMEGLVHLFYKDVYLDIYQLVEIVASLSQVDENRLSSYGGSQGGALALVAAALNPRIQKTVAIYPFLSDFRQVIEIGNTSVAYDELFRHFKFHDAFDETAEQIMSILAYIDVKNLVHRSQREVKMITGLDDDDCYPITQFAIYNRQTCDQIYRIMPEYAHEVMTVFVNDHVYNWLCGSEIPFKYLKLLVDSNHKILKIINTHSISGLRKLYTMRFIMVV